MYKLYADICIYANRKKGWNKKVHITNTMQGHFLERMEDHQHYSNPRSIISCSTQKKLDRPKEIRPLLCTTKQPTSPNTS